MLVTRVETFLCLVGRSCAKPEKEDSLRITQFVQKVTFPDVKTKKFDLADLCLSQVHSFQSVP